MTVAPKMPIAKKIPCGSRNVARSGTKPLLMATKSGPTKISSTVKQAAIVTIKPSMIAST